MALRRTLNTLQAGRGFAALAVLLFHVDVTLGLEKYLGRKIFPMVDGGYLGVAFFFVLSGFVILLAHQKDIGRPDRVGSFLWRRFIRLFPLLWIALILAILGSILATRQLPHPWDVTSSFLALPADKEPFLSVEWTLRREVLFYILFAIFLHTRVIGGILLGSWFLLSAVVPFVDPPFPANVLFDTYHLLFGMGMLVCTLYVRDKIRYPKQLILVGAVLFFGMWMLLGYEYIPKSVFHRIPVGIGAMLVIAGLVGWECSREIKVPAPLVFLGEASYSIYLVHYLAVSALCKIVMRFAQVLPASLLFAIVAIGALLAGIGFHLAVEKPLMRVLRTPRARSDAGAAMER